MTDVWDPWQPRVGQRVRVRLSGECDMHDPDEDGVTGFIDAHLTQAMFDRDNATANDPEDVITVEGLRHHVWSVTFDEPRGMVGLALNGRVAVIPTEESLYCAAELVPLED